MVARCLIISDQPAAYHVIRQRFQQQKFESEVWFLEAQDLRFFSAVTEHGHPAVVLLDITANPTRSLAATARTRALFPNAKVAVRTPNSSTNFCYLAMKAGAHGVIDSSAYGNTKDLSLLVDSIVAGNLIYRRFDSPR